MNPPRGSAARPLVLVAIAVLAMLVVAITGTVMAILGSEIGCVSGGGSAVAAPPTRAAVKEIPPARLRLYQEAGKRFDVDWAFLASIGYQECGHGTCAEVNSSGCGGPMQIGMVRESACSPGPGPTIWERYRFDADGGGADPFSPADAIFTAARMMRPVFGLSGDSYAAYRQVACNYYGACGDGVANYADEVMARAVEYGFRGKGSPPATSPVATENVAAGGSGCGGSSSTNTSSGSEIVRIARSQLGTGENPPGSNCNPYGPCVQWCGLFVSWVWKRAGVPMEGSTATYAYSGSIYTWAETHEHDPFAVPSLGGKAPHSSGGGESAARALPPTVTPTPGDAVFYGTGPGYGEGEYSAHVGLVERVFPGGQITTIDGNFGDSVARSGPFLPSLAAAYGMPGPIYGYAHPPSVKGEDGTDG